MQTQPCPAPSWYLLRAKPQQEDIAKLALEREGYTVFLPNYYTRKTQAGAPFLAVEPLFPNYLFIQLGDEVARTHSEAIEAIRGVAKLVVERGGSLTRVDTGLIRALKWRELTSTGSLPVLTSNGYPDREKDQALETIYRNTNSTRRCTILHNLLHEPVIVNLDDFRKRRLQRVS